MYKQTNIIQTSFPPSVMSSFIVCQLNPDKYLKRKKQHYITVNYVKLQGEEIFERKSSFTKRK